MELLRHLIGELRDVGVSIIGVGVRVGHCLTKCSPHSDVIGEVCCQSPVEVCVGSLQMGGKTAVLHRQVVIFLFVHLFVDDILLGDSE